MEEAETTKDTAFIEYIYELNGGLELTEAFKQSLEAIDKIDIAQFNRIGLKTYAKDKWTLHKILQHLIDWERIWCFRAIIFGRAEGSTPDAHDQEIMVDNSNADERTIEELVNELRIVRQSSIMMFESFNEKILNTNCKFYAYEMPLYALGLAITTHQIHHFNTIKERYTPLDK